MNELTKGITRYDDKRRAETPCNTTLRGIIKATGVNGYTVSIDGEEYTNIMVLNGVSLSINDTVILIVPNNQLNNIFILGKLG